MRQGLQLQSLAEELEFQNDTKRDFLVKTKALHIVPERAEDGPYGIVIKGKQEEGFELSRYMFSQLAAHTKVPMSLIDVMSAGTKRERVELGNLLTVRLQENDCTRMVRTVGRHDDEPIARAFLSDRYRTIDNWDVAEAVLPVINELDDLVVKSCDITETRMYLKLVYPEMNFNLGMTRDKNGRKVGDIVEGGLVVSNSEVGAGRIAIEPFLYRLVCANGMVSNAYAHRKNHVGRKNEIDVFGDAQELYSDETKALDDAAFFGKIQDTVRAVLTDPAKFETMVARVMEARGESIVGHPEAVVHEVAKRFTLSQDESQSVLRHLIKGGKLNKFGLMNAVTATAKSKKLSYDRCSELERMGGNIIELGPSEWKVIASARLKKGKVENN